MTKFTGGPLLVFFSLLVGSLSAIFVPVGIEAARDQYDAANPAWVPQKVLVMAMNTSTVELNIEGTKARECDPLRAWAQVLYRDRPPSDAQVLRPGGRPVGYLNRPLGYQDLGRFFVSPIPADASGVVIHMEHDCSGRIVKSILGKADLR